MIAVVGVADRFSYAGYDPTTVSYDSGPTTLVHEDGTPITNIVPYGPDGEPLTGVLLYDQDGRPIDNLSTYTTDGSEVRSQGGPAQPDGDVRLAHGKVELLIGEDELHADLGVEVPPGF